MRVITRRRIILVASTFLLMLFPVGAYLAVGGSPILERLILSQYPDITADLRNFVKDLDQDVAGIGSTRNIPLFELSFSRKDILHFSELRRRYSEYEAGQYKGFNYYLANNNWRKAKLRFEGKQYNVKIKSHGRKPSNHTKGKFISFTVKLGKVDQIRKTKRFNLIIRERITFWGIVYKDFAKLFGLLAQDIDLVRVKINNWDEKLYYFEKRLNDSYMESIGKSSLRIFSYDDGINPTDKSMVFSGSRPGNSFSEESFKRKFAQVLAQTDYSESSRKGFFERYLNFNRAIAENNVDEIIDYVDFDYITDFLAAVSIGGLLQHGFTQTNLYVFMDSANGKFYPIMQRDILQRAIVPKPGKTFEETNNDIVVSAALFHVLEQNDLIRQEKYRKIHDFIRKHGDETIRRQKNIWQEYESLHYLGMLKLFVAKFGVDDWIGRYKDHTGTNISVLKNYIARSQVASRIRISDERMVIHVEPDSMSAIRFNELKIKTSGLFSPTNVRIRVHSRSGDQPVILTATGKYTLQPNSGYIDLLPAVRELGFSTALGPGSEAVRRNYEVFFEFDERLPSDFSKEDIRVGFENSITGEAVGTGEIPVHAMESIIEMPPGKGFPVPGDPLVIWKKAHPDLKASLEGGNVVRLHPGSHEILEDLILPETAKLVIGPGTTIRIGAGKALLARNGADILGTAEQPVVITSIDPDKPFGSVGILGNEKTNTRISYLHLSNGSEKWLEGIYLSGALSLHNNGMVTISNSTITNNRGDDGINIKNGSVRIENSRFIDNAFDQMDLDYCRGTIENTVFINSRPGNNNNQDGLDISGSKILLSNSRFYGFRDKGVSIGEESAVILYSNRIEKNNNGVAVKDLSKAYFLDNAFIGNKVDINLYQKKQIFGGGHGYVINSGAREAGIIYSMDKKSTLRRLRVDDAHIKNLMELGSVGIEKLFLRLEEMLTSLQPAISSSEEKAL